MVLACAGADQVIALLGMIWSLPPSPTITSARSVPSSTSLPSVPTIVAVCPSHLGSAGGIGGGGMSTPTVNASVAGVASVFAVPSESVARTRKV